MTTVTNPYFGYKKDDGRVKSLWERYNAGLLDVEGLREPHQKLLVSEWQRCSALGVDVAMNRGRRLSDVEYERRRKANSLLLTKSQPILRGIGEYLKDVPGIMILTENTGTVLHVEGDADIRAIAADRSGIMEGSVWQEDVAGSNGIGSALTLRQPVHVFSSEHFCEGWHLWTCAAAPIFEADDDTLLGVVDFTTIARDYRDQAVGLAVSLAKSIQAQIALHRELEKRCLLAFFSECVGRYANDAVIALDLRGKPVAGSPPDWCRRPLEVLSKGGRIAAELVLSECEVKGPDGAAVGTVIVLRRGSASAGSASRVSPVPDTRAAQLPFSGETVSFGKFLTADPSTAKLLSDLPRLAGLDVNLLVTGETGTGKELLARHLHDISRRSAQPYIAINCGAINRSLLESAFFGYVGGAFSGADPKGRPGYFEAVGAGTLFLDEIGELPLDMQAALLRVLEDGSFQRVGSYETRTAKCRIIAATNRDLLEEVADGRFRKDLYYRLNIVKLSVPPLRKRTSDIEALSRLFLDRVAERHGLARAVLTPAALEALTSYEWPGNVRELRNAMETAALSGEAEIFPEHLPSDLLQVAPVKRDGSRMMDSDNERERIIAALKLHRKANRAAAALGMARSTLYRKLDSLGIDHAAYL